MMPGLRSLVQLSRQLQPVYSRTCACQKRGYLLLFVQYVKDKPSFWPGVEKCLRVRIFLQVVGGGGDETTPVSGS